MIFASIETNQFLTNYAIWIPVGIVGVILIVLLFYLIVSLCNKNKKKVIDPSNNEALFEALGGKDNLIDAELKGSRLKITIKSNEKIDQIKLKEIGIDNTIVMSNQVTLILNDKTKEEFKNFKLD